MQLIITVHLPFFSFSMDWTITAPPTDSAPRPRKDGVAWFPYFLCKEAGRAVEAQGPKPRAHIVEGKGAAGVWCDGVEA